MPTATITYSLTSALDDEDLRLALAGERYDAAWKELKETLAEQKVNTLIDISVLIRELEEKHDLPRIP
jgi:hypothetical protein